MIEELGKHRQRIHRLEQYFQLLHKRVLGKQVEWETLNDAGELDAIKVSRMDEIDARLSAVESGTTSETANIHIAELARKVEALELRPSGSGEFHTDFSPVLRQIEALKAENQGLQRMVQTLAQANDNMQQTVREIVDVLSKIEVRTDLVRRVS